MKKVKIIIKKVVFSVFILYGFNVIGSNFNLIIPINFFTVLLVSFLGIPMLISLIFLLVNM